MPRIRIGKQTELSAVAGSLVVTDAAKEQIYLAPGTAGQTIKIVAGVPTYVNAAGTVTVVADIAARDALGATWGALETGNIVKVLSDGSVDPIAKTYVWTGTAFEDISIDPRELNNLSDVIITVPVIGDTLVYNGTTWVNTPQVLEATDEVTGLTAGSSVTLANTPANSPKVYRNGVRQLTSQYSVVGAVITFVDAFGNSAGGAGPEDVTVDYKY